MFKVGDIVQTQFDTGAFGLQTLWGLVELSGPKTFTVQWESGIRNRLYHADKRVSAVRADVLDDAKASLCRLGILSDTELSS